MGKHHSILNLKREPEVGKKSLWFTQQLVLLTQRTEASVSSLAFLQDFLLLANGKKERWRILTHCAVPQANFGFLNQ